jgi:hypothetical protein
MAEVGKWQILGGDLPLKIFKKKMLLKVDFLDKLDNSEQKKIVLEVDFQKNVSMRHCIPDLRTALNWSILILSQNPEKIPRSISLNFTNPGGISLSAINKKVSFLRRKKKTRKSL